MSEKLKEIIENMPKDILINSFETVYEDSIKKDLEIERLNNKLELINKIVEREFPPNEFITYKIKKILKGSDKE